MPKASAATRTEMLDRALNPVIAAGSTITINLRTDRNINPEDIFDAFEAEFGAGKTSADTDVVSGAAYNLRIAA